MVIPNLTVVGEIVGRRHTFASGTMGKSTEFPMGTKKFSFAMTYGSDDGSIYMNRFLMLGGENGDEFAKTIKNQSFVSQVYRQGDQTVEIIGHGSKGDKTFRYVTDVGSDGYTAVGTWSDKFFNSEKVSTVATQRSRTAFAIKIGSVSAQNNIFLSFNYPNGLGTDSSQLPRILISVTPGVFDSGNFTSNGHITRKNHLTGETISKQEVLGGSSVARIRDLQLAAGHMFSPISSSRPSYLAMDFFLNSNNTLLTQLRDNETGHAVLDNVLINTPEMFQITGTGHDLLDSIGKGTITLTIEGANKMKATLEIIPESTEEDILKYVLGLREVTGLLPPNQIV